MFAILTAGYYHTCGLTASGIAYCWGYNDSGQLGDGTSTADRSLPEPVFGGVLFAHLTGGYWHTCGLTAEGVAQCWGNDNWSQLGDSARTTRGTTQPVAGGIDFVYLRAGGRHSCGLSAAGSAYCWGWNGFGQVGDGTLTKEIIPTVVLTRGLLFGSISTGFNHTCGLTETGAAYCWGCNVNGQLGDGTTVNRSTPTRVVQSLAFAKLALGLNHSCGMTATNDLYCWGSNASGQLGDGTTTDRAVATAVK